MSGRQTIMPRIARLRRVSDEYLLAEAVIDVHRGAVEASAVELGLLDRDRDGWRARQALAEIMAGLILARAAGLDWPEACRLARQAAAEVRTVELRRGPP